MIVSPFRGVQKRDEEGAVTVETAAVLMPLAMILVLALSIVVVVHAQLRTVDAAREGARLAARGEDRARVLAAAERLAPSGAKVTLRREGSVVRVTVRSVARPLTRLLPGFPVRAEASVEAEDR